MSATPERRRTSWFDGLNISTHAELCFDATTWFSLPPIEPRFTHASTVNESPTFKDDVAGTDTFPVDPSNDAAVFESPEIAPGTPSVTPPWYEPEFKPMLSQATDPEPSPSRQYPTSPAVPATACAYDDEELDTAQVVAAS